ncbi:hypothetical protein TRV_07711 [Trichophyton verrucosum HKI 0517]|uniref:Uncharacterized protein n=1 Tax=Trichophyton verrucosum (strain HKI 0517) TaxID=663202 RepID=D4DKI9_TRIVH|nr:uncharacterized protein TRV_07711 [Trichophyton verrucosum HKI 0517]EFE37616.1 hypothetical protein TRV_07711 [Trichophyton verrucosum HKI 0517]
MREVAICEPKLSELSAIDSRINLLKKSLGFLLPNRNSQWLKEAMKIISDRIKPRQHSFCALAVSIEGLEGYTIAADCLFFTVSQSSVIVLSMDKYRFNLIDIPLASIKGTEAKGNKLRIILGQRCYLVVNGVEQYSNNILIGMETPRHVEAAIKAVRNIIELTTRDNETPLYKRAKEGAMAIIAFHDCVNDFEPEAPIGLHISIHADSDHDAGCMLWQESHRQPSSSAIIELPTGEEVLSASQLSLQSSRPLQSQPLHQQPREQCVSNQTGGTPATGGPAPVKERRTTKLSEKKEGADTTLNPVNRRKRERGDASQVSKNVRQFMSRNQLSAQKPIISSNARKSGQEKSKDQGKPTSKSDEVNSNTLSLQNGNRTANVVQTQIPPMTTTRYEQQKPTRSVKFDLGAGHTPTSSTGPSDNANSIDGKAVLDLAMRKESSSALRSLTNDDAPMALENTGDEDEDLTSSSLDELLKYTSVRTKQIGWQSRTVDENGSPIPRLQHARKNYSQRVLGMLDGTDKPKVAPHIDMPPAISEPSQHQGMTTLNPPAYNHLKRGANRDITDRHSFQSSNMFASEERHSRRCRSMRANDLFYDQKIHRGKFEGQNKSATSSYKKSFDLMQRLKAHQHNPIPRTMGKTHHIDVRDSKPFKAIQNDEDAVNIEAETDDECSPPRYLPECSEYVECQGHEWEKHLRDNYREGGDILSDTSKVSTKVTPTYSPLIPRMLIFLPNANQHFQIATLPMIDQLEEIHSEKLDQSEHALRPIKKRFLGMFENFSKRLANDLESIHKASSTLPTAANRGQRLNGEINSAIDEYKSRLIKSTNT